MRVEKISKKQIIIYVLSFLTPAIIYACMYAQNGIVYGGNKTVLLSDLYSQFMPDTASIRYLFSGENSIFFNWACDLGGDYYALFAYYLASPLNFLTLLWNIKDFPDAILFLMILKVGFSGLAFCFFIHYGIMEKENEWTDVIFCCCYSLMSYIIVFGMCISWLDTIIMLPIVLIGTKQIVNGKKSTLFIVSLFILFLVNFYMAISAGIYVFLYFVSLIVAESKQSAEDCCAIKFGRFIVHTAISILLSMFLLLPTGLKILQNFFVEDLPTDRLEIEQSINFARLFRMLLPYQYVGTGIQGVQPPYIFCGTAIILLTIVFFVMNNKLRLKIASLILIIPLAVGFFSSRINLAWHGFQAPHGFQYRYSYLFSTSLIIVSIYSFSIIKQGMIGKKIQYTLYFACLYTICELLFNGTYVMSQLSDDIGYVTRDSYIYMDSIYGKMKQYIGEKENSDSWYRISEDFGFVSFNAGLMYDFAGTSYFSSSYNAEISKLFYALGCASGGRTVGMSGALPFVNSLFGVKYIISDSDLLCPYIKLYDYNDDMALYYNPDSLGIGFTMPYNIDQLTLKYSGVNPIGMNNVLTYFMSGQECYSEVAAAHYLDENGSLNLKIPCSEIETDKLYIFISNMERENNSAISSQIRTENNVFRKYTSGGKRMMIEIPVAFEREENDYDIYFDNINSDYEGNIQVFQEKTEILQYIMEDLRQRQIYDVIKKKNGIIGKINALEDSSLFFTLPYEKGFRVKVDGKMVETKKLLNAFLGVSISEGTHVIEVTYVPYGVGTGCALSAIGMILFVVYLKKNK